MPAQRSRTENWRRSLDQLASREGSLEITLPRYLEPDEKGAAGAMPHQDIIWRVRIAQVSDDEIVVERPSMLGRTIELAEGLPLIGIIAIGQNRWMFQTTVNEWREGIAVGGRRTTCLALQMPESVERCQRRNFYRVSTVGLDLPVVGCYPLLDPRSSAAAEVANRAEIERLQDADVIGQIGQDDTPALMPTVGPRFEATMVNLGGGGIGLMVEPKDRSIFDNHKLFWLMIPLKPHVPIPVAVTARCRHTHVDSSQRLYVGLSFDFGANPDHQRFVVDQICRYVAQVQRVQLARQNTA